MNNLSTKFEEYLKTNRKVGSKTLRNYRSDVSYFVSWARKYLANYKINATLLEEIAPYISGMLVASYKAFHLDSKIPSATTNRRLSALRNLTEFLHLEGWIASNPSKNLTNIASNQQPIEKLLSSFEKHLETENMSKITIKNYISDVRHFLSWVKTNQI